MIDQTSSATQIAQAVSLGSVSALEVTEAALKRIETGNPRLNAFSAVTATRALAEAKEIDARRARGEPMGPLAGVPYAVKNLYDIAGMTTIAGSKIDAEEPPAASDATAVNRLKAAGAVLVGALHMDEYAYGFTCENSHYGPTRNPHDTDCVPGGSSGGSAAAVAGGLVPLSLGSDTNGSIRVPAALCGIFGLKPTYGRLSRGGAKLFAGSFDHIGPFARSVRDLAAAYDAMQGPDSRDPVCQSVEIEPVLPQLGRSLAGLRVAVAGGYFAPPGVEAALEAVQKVAGALGAIKRVDIPQAERARAAAFLVTAAEGANLHFANIRSRPQDFDIGTRDRFIAGSLVPAVWVQQAQRFRRWYRAQMLKLFAEVDIILAPSTPGPAPRIGDDSMPIPGAQLPVRANLGVFTQPLSFLGLPIVAVPVQREGALPLGVQIIAGPWKEAMALRVADALERQGVVSAPVAG